MLFHDEFFPPRPGRLRHYLRHVALGKQQAASQQVVIGGLARNLGELTTLTMQRLVATAELFADARIVIYENDSADDTPRLIRAAIAEPWVTKLVFVSETLRWPVNPGTRCLERMERMAILRNRWRELVNSLDFDFRHVIVADLDLVGGWSLPGLLTTFSRSGWDAVGANGILFRDYGNEQNKPVHFDAWAYRHQGSDVALTTEEVNVWRHLPGDDWIPVNSCFGGLGVYTREAFRRGVYTGGDCEHVTFHRRLREAGLGRIFLNPAQITHYGGQPNE